MKKIAISSILVFLSINLANAQDMCGEPCRVIIDFPTGGVITASEGMLITFGLDGELAPGEAGTINTAIQPDSIDYSTGGSLALAPGESITFGNNGMLNLGDGGNINAINYSIVSSGDILILVLTNEAYISGTLEAQAVLIDSRTIFINDENSINTENLAITGIDVSALDVSITTDFSELWDGFVFSIDENISCTVTGSECITDDGTAYVLNKDGEIVEVTEGSGSIDLLSLKILLIISLFMYARKKQSSI